MKLNLDVICDNLPESYIARRYGPENKKQTFNRPLLFDQNTQMNPTCLYIASVGALPTKPAAGTAMIIVGGKLPQIWLTSGAQVLHLEGKSDLLAAMRDVFAVFDKFDLWDEQLRDGVEDFDNLNINQLLLLGAEVLENSVIVHNYKLEQIALCELVTNEDGSIGFMSYNRDALKDTHQNDPSAWEAINSVCHAERKITEPYLSNIPIDGLEAYCCNIYSFGHFVGCLHIRNQHRPFRNSDFPLADRLFVYLKKVFLRYLSTTNDEVAPETEALCSILDRLPLGAANADCFVLSGNKYWRCFKLKEKRGIRCLPKEYLCENLRGLIADTIFPVIHHEELLGLIRLDHGSKDKVASSLRLFGDITDDMGYVAGLSGEFTDVRDAMPYYIQAAYAVENAVRNGSEAHLNYFSDFALEYMLYECMGEMPLIALIPKGLSELLYLDRQKDSDYIRTLDIYLRNETNASRTAEELFIHRSSFIKRFEKIQRIIDMDLDDPDVRLRLRIYLKLIEKEGTTFCKV